MIVLWYLPLMPLYWADICVRVQQISTIIYLMYGKEFYLGLKNLNLFSLIWIKKLVIVKSIIVIVLNVLLPPVLMCSLRFQRSPESNQNICWKNSLVETLCPCFDLRHVSIRCPDSEWTQCADIRRHTRISKFTCAEQRKTERLCTRTFLWVRTASTEKTISFRSNSDTMISIWIKRCISSLPVVMNLPTKVRICLSNH